MTPLNCSTYDFRKEGIPDIVVTSYPGSTQEKRDKRLGFHLRTRETLAKLFPKLKIVSLCSDYTKAERKFITVDLDTDFPCLFFEGRVAKWRKHNFVLKWLYNCAKPKSVLFLDDDVVPREPKETDAENGMTNTVELVKSWLKHPDLMPGPLCFFSCMGLLIDAYYKSNPVIAPPPAAVTGWAIMMRSDLKVLYTKDLIESKDRVAMPDDTPFRIKCSIEGKEVFKHYRAFFKSFQSKDQAHVDSAYFKTHKLRKRGNKEMMERMREMFPDFFAGKGKKKPRSKVGFSARKDD